MFFQKKKSLNDVDLKMCNPVIVNQTNHSVVLFLDRGVLYNKQILAPGEAVGMTRKETAGTVLPYKIHAVVGDEKSLPTRRQSVKNLASTAVIPTAFIVGTLAAASSAGTLTGPSQALSRAAGGLVVRGMVIDSAALAAGSIAANRASMIADKLLEEKKENFFAKTGHLLPGNRCVVIQGGIDEPLTITTIKEKQFRQIPIEGVVKTPMDTLQDKFEYYVPAMLGGSSKTEGPDENDIKAITEGAGGVSDNDGVVPVIEEQKEEAAAEPAAIAPTVPTASEEDRQIRLAIEESAAAVAAPKESDEDRQMRLAIEESLNLEEQRKKQEEEYNKLLKDDTRNPVVLF